MANDDFSEPPRRTDSKNLSFIFFRLLGPRHHRGPGVSLGRILGVMSIEPFFWVGACSQGAVSTAPTLKARPPKGKGVATDLDVLLVVCIDQAPRVSAVDGGPEAAPVHRCGTGHALDQNRVQSHAAFLRAAVQAGGSPVRCCAHADVDADGDATGRGAGVGCWVRL